MKHEQEHIVLSFWKAIRLFIKDVPLIPIENLRFVLNGLLKIKSSARRHTHTQRGMRGCRNSGKRTIVPKMYTFKKIVRETVRHSIKVGAESRILVIVLFESLLLLSETIHECVVDYR